MSDRKESGSFLNRWSTRKQQSARPMVNDEVALESGTVPADLTVTAESTDLLSGGLLPGELSGNDLLTAEPQSDTVETHDHDSDMQTDSAVPAEQASALLTDADMPAIETLTASSDISGFLGKGVSAALRKAALRHVFSQPKYNIRDGLDDYDDDYTSFEPLGDTVTSDMKFHAARKERERLASERLMQEQAQRELDAPDNAETGQDAPQAVEEVRSDQPAEEESDTDREAVSGTDQEDHLSVVNTEEDTGQDVGLSPEDAPAPASARASDQRSDNNTPLNNKKTLASASQSCEVPNE